MAFTFKMWLTNYAEGGKEQDSPFLLCRLQAHPLVAWGPVAQGFEIGLAVDSWWLYLLFAKLPSLGPGG